MAFDAAAERRARQFRTPREEREMLMMRRPVSVERAYALFGLLLGALPPAAIFVRLFGYGFTYERDWGYFTLPAMCLAMNTICAFVGHRMGRAVGQPMIAGAERHSWTRTLLFTVLAAFAWATATGAAGGAVFFGVGAIFGAFIALAVALPAFVVFTVFHRLLARGGMIEARHLRPLAWGVAATAAALVAGL
ncbi:MAG TPA: hypothetical protein VIP46_06310 [Pyrinomonadaceae bacterium]